ncbi:hypothetical protein VTJ49DRAFT_6958 [Mycothermus thermophilus]|uniref:MARVEL domain-containing protein n=1 Tax=Humicola insolens TaxID=85995 RepID=A0ABR3VI39_HUMIN
MNKWAVNVNVSGAKLDPKLAVTSATGEKQMLSAGMLLRIYGRFVPDKRVITVDMANSEEDSAAAGSGRGSDPSTSTTPNSQGEKHQKTAHPPATMDPLRPDVPYVSPRGMWVTKFIFRVLQFTFSIIVIGLTGSMYSQRAWSILEVVCIFPVVGLSAAWALAEGIAILVRGGHRGIHPGANVALDLLIWLGIVPAITLPYIANPMYPGWGTYDSYRARYYSNYTYNPAADGIGMAALVLMGFIGAFHFITFVIACIETDRRNSQTPVVLVSNNGFAPQYPALATVVYSSQYPPVAYQSYQPQPQPQPQYDVPQLPPQTYQQGQVKA